MYGDDDEQNHGAVYVPSGYGGAVRGPEAAGAPPTLQGEVSRCGRDHRASDDGDDDDEFGLIDLG
jgi:hypothetical protein